MSITLVPTSHLIYSPITYVNEETQNSGDNTSWVTKRYQITNYV